MLEDVRRKQKARDMSPNNEQKIMNSIKKTK